MEEKEDLNTKENKIYLEYLGELTDLEIKLIQDQHLIVSLGLVFRNKSGVPYAILDDYSLVTYFAIHQALMLDILRNAGMSASWDAIKFILRYSWNRIRGKKYNKYQGGKFTEKEIKLGLKSQLDKNTSFNFELSGNLDSNDLNKVLDFIGRQKRNDSYKMPDYCFYDEKSEKWIKIDVTDEIRKKAKKKNKVLEKIINEKKKKKPKKN
ncbi:hypothetical protein U8527_08690 [Kordia algicida OT-1]|nr:hypothetical protein [Kordia algicida]